MTTMKKEESSKTKSTHHSTHIQHFHLKNIPKNIPKTDIPLTLQVNRIARAYMPTISNSLMLKTLYQVII